MASNYGLGQMYPQNLELSDIADVIVNPIKKNSNNNKMFAFQYKHPSKTFNLVKTDVAAHEHPHEHEPNSLANLDDIDETVAEMKNSNIATPFGFILNPLTKDFRVHQIINRDLFEILQQRVTNDDSIFENIPYVIYYNKTDKQFKLIDFRSYVEPAYLYKDYEIHLKISPIETITKSNNIVKRIINSGNLYLSYQASDNCILKYDSSLKYLSVSNEDGYLTLSTINQPMYNNIKTQTYGTMIIECIVNNTDGAEVKLIDDISFIAEKRMHVYIIIHIKERENAVVIETKGAEEGFTVSKKRKFDGSLDIEKIYIKNIELIDVKLLHRSLDHVEVDFLTS